MRATVFRLDGGWHYDLLDDEGDEIVACGGYERPYTQTWRETFDEACEALRGHAS